MVAWIGNGERSDHSPNVLKPGLGGNVSVLKIFSNRMKWVANGDRLLKTIKMVVMLVALLLHQESDSRKRRLQFYKVQA